MTAEGPKTEEVFDLLRTGSAPVAGTLLVVKGPDEGRMIHLDTSLYRIGADPLCDLVLVDPTSSRQHCQIKSMPEGYCLEDLGSTNGTFVDELRIREIFLDDGSLIHVGNTVLLFNLPRPQEDRESLKISASNKLIGKSREIQQIFREIIKVSPTDLSVVIEGETGTGKELVASAIHHHSRRAGGPFIVFDCSAFPANLIESELFGHEKGAFSGALNVHKGVFERANGGTIFFDEMGEMDVGFQAKFLRALESGEIRRVGGEKTFKVDVRVVSATNRDLEEMIAEGRFRSDLFYRIAKVRMLLPPLRDRVEDIPLLVSFFQENNTHRGLPCPTVTSSGLEVLCAYPWPGNIRELRNIIERSSALCDGGRVTGSFLRQELGLEEHFTRTLKDTPAVGISSVDEAEDRHEHLLPDPGENSVPLRDAKEQILNDFECRYLVRLLEKHEMNVSRAAREAKVDRRHFYRLLKKYDLMGQ